MTKLVDYALLARLKRLRELKRRIPSEEEQLAELYKRYPALQKFNPDVSDKEGHILLNNRREYDDELTNLIDRVGVSPPPVPLYRAETQYGSLGDVPLVESSPTNRTDRSHSMITDPSEMHRYLDMFPDAMKDYGPEGYMPVVGSYDVDKNVPAIPALFDDREWILPKGSYLADKREGIAPEQLQRFFEQRRAQLAKKTRDQSALPERLQYLLGTIKRSDGGRVDAY